MEGSASVWGTAEMGMMGMGSPGDILQSCPVGFGSWEMRAGMERGGQRSGGAGEESRLGRGKSGGGIGSWVGGG